MNKEIKPRKSKNDDVYFIYTNDKTQDVLVGHIQYVNGERIYFQVAGIYGDKDVRLACGEPLDGTPDPETVLKQFWNGSLNK